MTIRRLTLIALAIVPLAFAGCQRAVPIPVEMQEDSPPAQKKAKLGVVHSATVDANIFRVRLLMVDAVQKDLGLTADQKGKIMDFVRAFAKESREFAAKWPDVFASNGPAHMSEARSREFRAGLSDFQSKQRELRAKMVGTLTPSQSERLKQIRLQQTIAGALTRPEVVKALGISERQLASIRSVNDRTEKKELALLGGPFPQSPGKRRKKSVELAKKSDEVHAEANKVAMEVLTPEQRAKLEKLVGRNVDLAWDYDVLVSDDAVF
jgi:hypothetical protein